MNSSERQRIAFRRSRWLIVLCATVGVAATMLLAQLQGPEYQSVASDIVQQYTAPLSTGSGTTPLEPQTEGANAATLAQSDAFYQFLAARLGGTTVKQLQKEISAQQTGTSNVVAFTASARTPGRARGLADAAARLFPAYSGLVSQAPILQAERSLSRRHRGPQVKASLAQLSLLQNLSGGVTPLGHAPQATKTRPRWATSAVEGLVAGLVVGFLTMALREAFDGRARLPEEVERELGVPVLGNLTVNPKKKQRKKKVKAAENAAASIGALLEEYGRSDRAAEIVVTSPVADEYRTLVAARLVEVLHKRERRVCAVDDGTGSLADRLSVDDDKASFSAAGVENVDDGATQQEASAGFVRWDPAGPSGTTVDHPDLRVLTSTQEHPRPWTNETLDGLRDDWDWVVIDTPSVSQSPRAGQLAPRADAVIVVVRLGVVTIEQLRAAAREWATWPHGPIAAILAS